MYTHVYIYIYIYIYTPPDDRGAPPRPRGESGPRERVAAARPPPRNSVQIFLAPVGHCGESAQACEDFVVRIPKAFGLACNLRHGQQCLRACHALGFQTCTGAMRRKKPETNRMHGGPRQRQQ